MISRFDFQPLSVAKIDIFFNRNRPNEDHVASPTWRLNLEVVWHRGKSRDISPREVTGLEGVPLSSIPNLTLSY